MDLMEEMLQWMGLLSMEDSGLLLSYKEEKEKERITKLVREKNKLYKVGNYDILTIFFQGVKNNKYEWTNPLSYMNQKVMQWNGKTKEIRDSFIKEGIPFLYSLIGDYKNQVKIWLPEREEKGAIYSNTKNKVELSYAIQIGTLVYYQPIRFKKKCCYIKEDQDIKKYTQYKGVSILAVLSLLCCIKNKAIELKEDNIYFTHILSECISNLYQNDWEINVEIPEDFKKELLRRNYKKVNHYYTKEREGNKAKPISHICSVQCVERVFYDFQKTIVYGIEISLENYFVQPSYLQYELFEVLEYLLPLLEEHYHAIKKEMDRETKLGKCIARACDTKKNIPDKIIKAMKHTRFKKYFDFVEFDEYVDLLKIHQIEEECEKLMRDVFLYHIYENTTLRIRKLGKHHAAGLYYRKLGCLCVDVNYPSSFVHEYFHLVDDQKGDLSLSNDFYEVRQAYKDCLLKKKDGKLLKKKGKYNLNYYLTPTEVFARCGELYLFRIKGVVSSLLQLNEDVVTYPVDANLEVLIENYYSKLLTKKEGNSDERTLC